MNSQDPDDSSDPNPEEAKLDDSTGDKDSASGSSSDPDTGDLSDHPLNDSKNVETSVAPSGADIGAISKGDHPLSDADSGGYIVENLQPNTTSLSSDPNATLARTGDTTHILLLSFSLISAFASVFFLGVGIRRSAF